MKVLNLHKDKISEESVYIGRPSKWGNPFVIGKDGNREQVIKKYEKWILSQPKLMNELKELTGKDLVCYCSPKACHGDILKKLIENNLENKE